MADFMDHEAMESDDDNNNSDEEQVGSGKKKSSNKRALDSSDDEEEEEDEDKIREEMGDFIADDDEDDTGVDVRRKRKKKKRRRSNSGSGSGGSSRSGSRSRSRSRSGSGSRSRSGSRQRRRSRSRSRSGSNEDLDDEDMDLIQENLGVKFQKKRSRIQDMDSDDESDHERSRRDSGSGSEKGGERGGDSGGSGVDESDDDGFIVDEEGKPIERKKVKKKHIFDDASKQMAEDIFGVAFDYEEFEQYEGSGPESASDADDVEDMDEDELGERRAARRRRKKPAKTIFDIFDPYELEKGHYTDLDQEIRTTDIPERMQLRQVPVSAPPDDSDELDREADWIYKHGFCKQTITNQAKYSPEDIAGWMRSGSTTEKIKKALDFMRLQFLEVPFIAFYRREYVEPELKEIDDLWRVYYMDEKWCQLQTRKKNIHKLFQKMQDYQNEVFLKDLDSALPEGTVMVTQEDMDRLDVVETVEDLRDVYQNFLLYHGRHISACQESFRNKQKEERALRRAKKKLGKEKKYKTVKRKMRRKATKTVTKVVQEQVMNDDTGEQEMVDKEVEEEVETEVDTEVDEEVTDEEAMMDDDNEEEEEDEDDQDLDNDVIKYARRNDAYSLGVKMKLSGITKHFGLTPEEFGENLQESYAKHEIPEETRDFEDVAAEYYNEKLTTKEAVAAAAVFMVATQIAKEPVVRATIREVFNERATISIKPTEKGVKEIGEEHELFPMKYLLNKPCRTFKHEEFYKVLMAKDSHLIEINLSEVLKGSNDESTYTMEAVELYREDGYSKRANEWNELRKRAVETALNVMLFPQIRKELIHRMRGEAIEGIKLKCQEALYEQIKWAPFGVDWKEDDYDEDDWDFSGGCRIMGLSYSDDKDDAGFGAMISAEGELSDYIKLPMILTSRKTWNEKLRVKKEKEIEILTMFLRNKRPHGIAICTDDRNAITVQRDMEELIHQMTGEDASFPSLKVVLVDNNLAKVYANTNKSNADFRDHPPVLKQAISAARRLQDPLVEFSQLCNSENDILCLRYHTHQEAIGEENLLATLNQVFINIVNKVGVDINECVAHPHCSNLVQFIGGLGPRKGASLLKTLRSMSNPRLENRQQLVTSCHMGPKVFINCAGFVKIDTTALGDSEQYIEVLDGSRIHNEAYEWARKMAVDALEYDDEEDEGNPASAVEDILRQPEKLEELNLDAFAEELERQGFGNKQITLYDIRDELNQPYGEKRTEFVGPSDIDIFDMTNKETPDTFYVGKMMQARVTGFYYVQPKPEEMDCAQPRKNDDTGMFACQFCGRDNFPELTEVWNHFDAENECPGKCLGVKIVLENAIPGFISIQDLSDNQVSKPEDRVKVNQNIHVRVTKILPEKGRVNCTSRTSALRDENEDFQRQKDDFYDSQAQKKELDKIKGNLKKQQGTQYIKRVIVHPQFHNISYKEAEKLLKEQDQGDVVIRPSSKGKDHLTVSWKVTEGIYQHIDIEEKGKTNAFSLGNSLIIAGEEFEDLDEIIARHINPMAANTREILGYKYFQNFESRKEAENYLMKERGSNSAKIPYAIYPSKEIFGKFMLSYALRNKVRHEYVSVTPDGFRFRKQNFDTLLLMIKWFKEHYRDPIPITPNMGRRTPYGSLTGGTTPGGGTTGRPGITPGALSMAGGNTPYGGTPGSRYNNSNAYTPTANTPFMTPNATTPGPSATPRGYGAAGGGNTPRGYGAPGGGSTPRGFGAPGGGTTPRGYVAPGGGNTPRGYGAPGGGTPRGYGTTPRDGGSGRATPGGHQQPSPAYKGRGSNAGNAWAAAAQNWAKGAGGADGRTPRGMAGDITPRGPVAGGENTPSYNKGGYSTTPRYEDKSRSTPQYNTSSRTPQYNSSSNRTPQYNSSSNRTPQYNTAGRTPTGSSRTPQYPSGGRTPQEHHGGGNRAPSRTPRTPRGQFGDATPLYDE